MIYHSNVLICYSILELLSNRKCQCYKMNGSGDDRLRNDDATSIASYHIIAISPIGFRHYNLFYIYRAVPFLTLCLMAAESTFGVWCV